MISVQGILIEYSPQNDKDFITPDFERVIEYYPHFCHQGGSLSFQGYMLEVTKYLEKAEARPGRVAEAWFQRYLAHFGLPHFKEACERYSSIAVLD